MSYHKVDIKDLYVDSKVVLTLKEGDKDVFGKVEDIDSDFIILNKEDERPLLMIAISEIKGASICFDGCYCCKYSNGRIDREGVCPCETGGCINCSCSCDVGPDCRVCEKEPIEICIECWEYHETSVPCDMNDLAYGGDRIDF